MTADRDSVRIPHRHLNGANGTRPKRVREDIILAPVDPVGNPAAEGTMVRGNGHMATRGTDDHSQRATKKGDMTES